MQSDPPMLRLLLALSCILGSSEAFASPEWVGTHCMEHDFRGKEIVIDSSICRELFPSHFVLNGCACEELTPKDALLGIEDDQTLCPGSRPSECVVPDAYQSNETSYSAE